MEANIINIKIIYGDKIINTTCEKNETALHVLQREDVFFSAECGGSGTCGKCGVLLNGELRLACQADITRDSVIEAQVCCHEKFNADAKAGYHGGHSLAIDIGTTTIAFKIAGGEASAFYMLNSQMKFGSDVISRISNAGGEKRRLLKETILNDLRLGIETIVSEGEKPERAVISCNTVMAYLLLGLDPKGLGVYPFTFETGKTIKTRIENVSGDVFLMPSISAFVGGDVLSGIIFTKMHEKANTVLIDIGTNTEIVLNAGGVMTAVSAPAGPAFEGGNITCGTGNIPGSVCGITYADGKFEIKTIGDKPPAGICGSGLIDLIGCLLDNGIIDRTGLLIDEFFEKGIYITDGIFLTQEDIRQFQLAKSGIRAAIEVLLSECGFGSEPDAVFLCGGFGSNLNIENSYKVGLFPKAFEKFIMCGNASLGGAEFVIKNNCTEEYIDSLRDGIRMIDVNDNERFHELFIKHIDF